MTDSQVHNEVAMSDVVRPGSPGRDAPWHKFAHLGVLLLLLIIAIGATCEISSRNEDYARLNKYQKWLVTCLQNKSASDAGCPPNEDAKGWKLNEALRTADEQVRRFDGLNSIGTHTKCLTVIVTTFPRAGFHEACLAFIDSRDKVNDESDRVLLDSIVHTGWPSFRAFPLYFDQQPKDVLYFVLVLVSAAIGSLVAGLRTSGFTTIRDLILGLGAGFAVYLLVRSGNFVFLASPAANIDILNPYSAAAVGMLVGLFSDRVFKLVDGMVGDAKSPDPIIKAPEARQGAVGDTRNAGTAPPSVSSPASESTPAKP